MLATAPFGEPGPDDRLLHLPQPGRGLRRRVREIACDDRGRRAGAAASGDQGQQAGDDQRNQQCPEKP
jgi:hypothetical protein